ncbi:MAG TPA: ScyD/ScyE family protein, partial [Pedococcus sp.]|uniref:ScyD/ScyE family protein n=1 Tax=Pedococcus sp. TaxID=2860345 RepID=UPI002F928292
RAKRLLAATGTVGVALSLTVAAPAAADPSWRVVASGLHSPRNLAVSPDGDVFVAESGRGGDGACTTHPALGDACVGSSGSITWVNPHGRDKRVVTGLPSIAGQEALGPMDLVVTDGGRYYATIGLGADEEVRDGFGKAGEHLATVVTGRLDSDEHKEFADVLAYEADANPDGTDVDSNPAGLSRAGEGLVVADAGGNAIVKVNEDGRFRTVAALEPTDEGADAVPTAVVRGPDGAWYVSQLTGFPFTQGSASIWRIGASGEPTVYASGLTNVTDLAFKGRTLYAVQIATEGLLSGPVGSLVEVPKGSTSPTVVVGDLEAPYGVVITDGSAYVSTCSVCLTGGQVIKVSLR